MKKILAAILIGLGGVSVLPALPRADAFRWEPSSVDRMFMGFSLQRESLEGDLDGKLVLGNYEKTFYIPRIRPAAGFSLSLGQLRKNGMWSVVYSMTPHSASFLGAGHHSISNVLEMVGRGYLMKKTALRPYVQLGFGPVWLHVSDGAFRGTTFHGANYLGLAVHGGGGFLIPISPRIFLNAGAIYRYTAYMYAKGPGRGRDVTNLYINQTGSRRDIFLKAPGFQLALGIGYLL
jgi:hypothetical protein